MTLVGMAFGQIGSVGGGRLLLDLEEEGVGAVRAAEAFEVDDVVAQAHGAGADDFERYVLGNVLLKKVAALGLEGAGIGAERGKDGCGFSSAEALEEWRIGAKDARLDGSVAGLGGGGFDAGVFGGVGYGEGLEKLLRSGAAGLGEDGGHGVGFGEAVNLVAAELKYGHGGEDVHHAAVLVGEVEDGIATCGAFDAGFPARKDEAGSEALEVVLEGTADGFVEVVDVEDEAAIGGGEGSEVEDVGVAAELGGDAGVGMAGEIGGHDGDGAAEEAEGAGGHALILNRNEAGNAAAHGGAKEFEGIVGAGVELEAGVCAACELLARTEAEGLAIGVREWGGGYRHKIKVLEDI
jgi:hypothetical protein